MFLTKEEYEIKKKQIDDAYLEKLLKMSTEDLNEVVDTYEAGLISRAPRTIDAILGELLEREMNNEGN
jgi:hypothetical protein